MSESSPILAAELRLAGVSVGSDARAGEGALGVPTASATAHALSAALEAGLDAPRAALRSYADERGGVQLSDNDDATVSLAVSDGEVLIAFADDGQIERLAFTMGADAAPRSGFWARLFGRG